VSENFGVIAQYIEGRSHNGLLFIELARYNGMDGENNTT